MRLGVIQNVGAGTGFGKLLKDPADALIFDAGVELAVRERPGAALAELHVAVRIQFTGLPEPQDLFMARFRVLSALQHDRPQAGHAQNECGEHACRTEADDDGPLRRERCGLRDRIGIVLRDRRFRAVRHFENFIFPTLDGHVDSIDDTHVAFFACVNGSLFQIQLLDLRRGDAQLPRGCLYEPRHVAVRRQRQITDTDHRGSSCFPS